MTNTMTNIIRDAPPTTCRTIWCLKLNFSQWGSSLVGRREWSDLDKILREMGESFRQNLSGDF